MREITLAATFSALLIIGGHWFPWRALLHRDCTVLRRISMGCYPFSRPPPWCCGRAAIGSHSL